jgi:hypothetical protein
MVDPYDRTGKAALSDRVAFAHVVAVHRAFVTALGASERYGLPSSNAALGGVLNDEWVREAGTVFRDSFLMNGRNLIAFYTTERDPKGGPKALDTDVLLDDFDLPKPKNAATLVGFKDSISSHVVHITAWRDRSFWKGNPLPKREWIDWDTHTRTFGDEVISALTGTAAEQHDWAVVFAFLLDACRQRRADPTCHWPQDLSDPTLVDKLLTKHRL